MSVRVVLYGEGPLDLGDEWPWTAPGNELQEDELGPAHVLVRRAIAQVRTCPEAAVRFQAPLRHRTGRHLRGGQLRSAGNIHRLIAAHQLASQRADLVVVLVDQDGDPRREAELSSGSPSPSSSRG